MAGKQRSDEDLEEDMALSAREQRNLAAIEDELGEKDPALVATFARARPPSAVLQRFPLPVRHVCLLLLALVALIVLHSLGLELSLAGSAILTVGLIAPWIVSAARGKRWHADAPRAPQTDADRDALTYTTQINPIGDRS